MKKALLVASLACAAYVGKAELESSTNIPLSARSLEKVLFSSPASAYLPDQAHIQCTFTNTSGAKSQWYLAGTNFHAGVSSTADFTVYVDEAVLQLMETGKVVDLQPTYRALYEHKQYERHLFLPWALWKYYSLKEIFSD